MGQRARLTLLQMLDGSPPTAKFEELTARYLSTATRREVVWESHPTMMGGGAGGGGGEGSTTDPRSEPQLQLLSQPRLVQAGTLPMSD
jgi:hypothetical protein